MTDHEFKAPTRPTCHGEGELDATVARLAEIRARADAATEGPWRVTRRAGMLRDVEAFHPCDTHSGAHEDPSVCEGSGIGVATGDLAAGACGALDAEFIAHARSDVPWLLAEVEVLALERDGARDRAARLEERLAAAAGDPATEPAIDVTHLDRQRQWSRDTFGPGPRTAGVLDHIRKELAEIEADPTDLAEWVDLIILAFDGAWRHGAEPSGIIAAIKAKQARNESRSWPDWRTAEPGKAIEHIAEGGGE